MYPTLLARYQHRMFASCVLCRSSDTAWFLERVVVKESDAALIEHVVACNAWIEPDTPGEPARAVLTSSCAQLATPLPDAERALLRHEGLQPSSGDWVVWTYTGEHHEAPTDTLVSLLHGFRGRGGFSGLSPPEQ